MKKNKRNMRAYFLNITFDWMKWNRNENENKQKVYLIYTMK